MPSTSISDNPSTTQGASRELKILTTPFSTASSSSSSQPEPPSPPPSPCPWLWRCHSCYTIYRLSVTRRCLDCDHTFCLGDAAGTGPASQKGGKKRKRGGPCKAEFDYTGWKTRGAWRRTMLLNQDPNPYQTTTTARNAKKGERNGNWGDEHKAATSKLSDSNETTTTIFDDKREHLFLRKQHNCFLHCDFPSECHHTLFRAQQEGRPILREALALDAARDAVAEANQLVLELGYDGSSSSSSYNTTKKKYGRRLTVQEYKQRRQRQNGGTRFPYSSSSDTLPLLPPVDEADEEDNNAVSPCSPTSPDPPGDLMREVVQQVSPIERDDDGENQNLLPPVSPGGTTRRRSLLVATDTPADFAATVAPLCFDDEDTYSDDDDEEGGDGDDECETTHENRHRQAKRSCRKIAQLTGQEEFGPFVFFDTTTTTSSSPTSPSPSAGGINNTSTTTSDIFVQNAQKASALDLQAAYSESAWFGNNSTVTTTISAGDHPSSPRSPERAVGKRDRMLALLGRRAEVSRSSSSFRDVDVRIDSTPAPQQGNHHHANVAGEEWDGWSDSSSSSSASPTSSVVGAGPDTDTDGDVAMRDAGAGAGAASSPPADDTGEDEDESPVTPPRRQRSGGDGTDADLRALLRMRNAFMRGDMI